jgi:hypothetical protein
VVDRQGVLRYRHEGFDPQSLLPEQMKMEIEQLLGAGSPTR